MNINYMIIGSGKICFTRFFCSLVCPCQSGILLESIYQNYGPNGNNCGMILGLESEDSTLDAQCINYNGFPWGGH